MSTHGDQRDRVCIMHLVESAAQRYNIETGVSTQMGTIYLEEPQLESPELIAAWPGIGNVGLVAADMLRGMLEAREFAEIEPWEFFYPRRVRVASGELGELEFPTSRFYFQKTGGRDLIFFIGEEQPGEAGKDVRLASLVLDVAQRFGCRRVYTAAAAVALVHHSLKPRVWAAPNRRELLEEVRGYGNTMLMSRIGGRHGQGNITGLNGLLLGIARTRGLDGVCLLGEVPVYVSQFPLSYPKASKSILEVLAANLGLALDFSEIDEVARGVEEGIDRLCEQFPDEVRQRIDQLKEAGYQEEEKSGLITDEDKKKIMQEIDGFFGKGERKID